MEDYTLNNIVINAVIFFVIFYFTYKRDKNSFIEQGDKVRVRSTVYHRIFNQGVVVKKSSIVKIQITNKYLTLFNTSANAYDIFPRRESLIDLIQQAKALFPHAQVIEI